MRAPATTKPAPPFSVSLLAACLAMTPVVCLAAEAFGVLPMWIGALAVVIPAVIGLASLSLVHPGLGSRLLLGLCGGVLACFPYDALRLGALALGLMPSDPVPGFGEALGLSPAWVAGYVWRYLGDGGGMGAAFAVLGLSGGRRGALFGSVVCACLFGTLALSAHGEALLFPLTVTTALIAGAGHLVWGAVLGALVVLIPSLGRRLWGDDASRASITVAIAGLRRLLPATPERALTALLILTTTFLVVQIGGAAASGSLALLSDAAHAAGDLGVLALATVAAVIARRLSRPELGGVLRAGAAAVNGVALLIVAGWLTLEALERIEGHEHVHVSGPIMLGIAIAGVAVDAIGIALLARFARSDLNVRGVVLHLIADAGGSVGAAIAAGLVVAGFPQADPIAGLLLAGLVALAALSLLRDVVRFALSGGRRAVEAGCHHHPASEAAPHEVEAGVS